MEIKTETKVVTYIEYDGIKFYRDGKGYWLSSHVSGKPTGANLPKEKCLKCV
jgi:hypothetical protein